MQDELMDVMDRVPAHALSVYLFLSKRADLDTKIGMSQQEISRATRLSVGAVRDALGWLEQPMYKDATLKTVEEIAPFIRITPAKGYHNITLLPPYVDAEQRIRFTFEDTDDRRLANLEKEVRRLASRNPRSRFSTYFRGEKQALIREIEGDLGRAVSIEEAFLLGAMVHSAGVERVKAAWRKKASEHERPIIAIYAMFMQKAFGKVRKESQEQESEVRYQPVARDETVI